MAKILIKFYAKLINNFLKRYININVFLFF